MLDDKTRVALTRKELVSHCLRLLALRVDPANGHLSRLAEEIDVHPTTLSAWIAQGYVPLFQCRKMQKKFGKRHVDLDDLCPQQYRNI